jgi:hypothetical protein
MDRKFKLSAAISISIFLTGCNTNPAILDSALQGALGQVAKSAGITGLASTSNSSDFLSPGHTRKNVVTKYVTSAAKTLDA